VAVRRKRREHFHAFMMDVHARIHAWRQASKRGLAKGEEPIAPVAAALAEEARLLCFDEFAVTDIADAMILGRLFEHLFRDGVTVVTTSNVEPRDLYRDGLNRTLFLPFIALFEARLETVRLEAERDYRFRTLSEAAVWFTPADDAARAALDRAFLALTGVPEGPPTTLPLLGRSIAVPNAAGGVARFPFAALCEAPLGSADFLSLARAFGTVIVDGIRVIGAGERNVAKRFITMIDTFYDERVKLIASAAAEPERLYDASEGYEMFEFNRVVSRLHEMRSADYLGLPHGHGRTSGDSAGLVET
ncbi:MAG TPA: cell division protein ZapE, partial [Lichenihabitans sp.]|nr:cell division protein ZapE [Lichenihabitans sp.]